jgi:hypothetical protein
MSVRVIIKWNLVINIHRVKETDIRIIIPPLPAGLLFTQIRRSCDGAPL